MATIPTYDNFQVGKASLPNTQLQAPQYQGNAGKQAQQIGNAMQQLGATLSSIETEKQHEANNTRIKEAENDAVKFEHAAEYGDNGFQNLQGKAALERPEGKSLQLEVGESYDKHIQAITKKLGNDAQKTMFKEIMMQRKMSFIGRVDRHVMQEHQQYKISVAKGTVEVAQNQMTLSWGEPSRINEARGAVISGLNDAATLQGWSKEELNAETIRALSPAHSSVIMQAVDAGKADYAREYYAQHKNEMTAGARLRASKAFDIHDDLAATQAHVDKIYAMEATPQTKMALAREITDPKQRAKTVAGLKARFHEDDWLQQRGYEQATQTAYGMLSNGKPIPASLFADLEPKARLVFEKMQRDGERPKENDPTVYHALANMSADEFAKVNMGQYVGQLKPSTWDTMVKKQAKLRSNGDYSFRTNLAKINSAIESLGIGKKDKGSFYDRADAWAHDLGHKPTDDELNKWITDMKEEVLTDHGRVWNTKVQIGNIHVDGVPDSEIADIVHALRSLGQEASNDNILKLYAKNPDAPSYNITPFGQRVK